jgi:hypothetical protein
MTRRASDYVQPLFQQQHSKDSTRTLANHLMEKTHTSTVEVAQETFAAGSGYKGKRAHRSCGS